MLDDLAAYAYGVRAQILTQMWDLQFNKQLGKEVLLGKNIARWFAVAS